MPGGGILLLMAWFELTIVGLGVATGNTDSGLLLLLGLAALFKLGSEREYRNQK